MIKKTEPKESQERIVEYKDFESAVTTNLIGRQGYSDDLSIS